MGNKKSRESLDGFSQYAQEVEDSMGADNYKAAEYSPARLSPDVPEIRRPPTPEYSTDETRSDDPAIYSPVSPMTPPDDPRPLSVIQEDPEVSTGAGAGATAPPAGPLPGLPPRSSSRLAPGAAAAVQARVPYTANSPGSRNAAGPAGLAPSPAIQPFTSSHHQQQQQTQAQVHSRSISTNSVPSIKVTDDGDASTIKAPASSTSSSSHPSAPAADEGEDEEQERGPAAQPGEPAYFPMLQHAAKMAPVACGAVLPAAPLRRAQLECFAGHYRLVASRNEDHPVACQSCRVADAGARFTCAHCAVRVCADCRDVLMMNGRDLGKLVEMLQS